MSQRNFLKINTISELIHILKKKQLTNLLSPILMLSNNHQILSQHKALQPQDIHPIQMSDLIIVCRVCKGKCKHTLLLQVHLVNMHQQVDDDGEATEVTQFKTACSQEEASP